MRIPGPITAVIGLPGAGKSFYALKIALRHIEDLQLKHLITNFDIDETKLYEYCSLAGYTYILSRIPRNFLIVRECSNIGRWLVDGDSLYILDESGIYLNSREFSAGGQERRDFLQCVSKIRHKNRLLFWVAQYYEQVDRVLRDLTASVLHCDSQTKYSKEIRNLVIHLQKAFLYDAVGWKLYCSKVDGKKKGFKALFQQNQLALQSWIAPLSDGDKVIFEIYSSFGDSDFAESEGCRVINPVRKVDFTAYLSLEEKYNRWLLDQAYDESERQEILKKIAKEPKQQEKEQIFQTSQVDENPFGF